MYRRRILSFQRRLLLFFSKTRTQTFTIQALLSMLAAEPMDASIFPPVAVETSVNHEKTVAPRSGFVISLFTISLDKTNTDITILVLRSGLVLLLLFGVYTRWYDSKSSSREGKRAAPVASPWLHLHHLGLPWTWNPEGVINSIIQKHGWQAPIEVRGGFLGNFTIIANPDHIKSIFKSSKTLTSKPQVLFSLRYLLAAPRRVLPFYQADDSGMGATPRKGSKTTRQEDRIHFWQASTAHKYMSNQHLVDLTERYVQTLSRNLNTVHLESDAADANDGWVEHDDLFKFLQIHVSTSAIESFMGSKILEMNPTLIEDFWKFDNSVPKFLRLLPRWIIPESYAVRDRLLEGIKRCHAHAHANFDRSRLGPDDPDWEPYFGSRFVRARQEYSRRMEPMDADAIASEELGLMFAANSNVLPCIFWYIFHALSDHELKEKLMAEVNYARHHDLDSPTKLDYDLATLTSQPLLQSTYAEVLRTKIAIAMTRVNEDNDFTLGDYIIRRNQTMVIFNRPPAFNEELAVWTSDNKSRKPLTEFDAERFLVPCQSTNDDNTKNSTSRAKDLEFSMEGMAGCWLPYGGGQRMCPGRHFAKNEILCTFAHIFTKFELELRLAPGDLAKVKPDLSRYPVGAMPPVCKVPFRIRRRRDV